MSENVLEVKDVSKQFPGVLANDNISFSLEKGTVHALLGENGAGKSTLMNIIYGLYHPDSGDIFVNGKRMYFTSPLDAMANGIGMVHQHFMLVSSLTVLENIILGVKDTKNPFVSLKRAHGIISDIAQQYGLAVPLNTLVEYIPVGVQQQVEIIKALYRKADILVLDEPTAVLIPREIDALFVIIKQLIQSGVSVVFISHKLKEVLSVSNTVTVIRHGKVVETLSTQETDEIQLAEYMVGRKVSLEVIRTPAQPKDTVLSIENITVKDSRKVLVVDNLSLKVRSGEIVGIAGVQNNGQSELALTIAGLQKISSGAIRLCGHDISHSSPRKISDLGLGHVPEDRQKEGLVLQQTIFENMVLNTYYKKPYANKGIRNFSAIYAHANELVTRFDVRPPVIEAVTGILSGGNQQKVIIAREFSRDIKLLIVVQPTRGLDIGSIEYIHSSIIKKRDEGCAVLLISTELDEILQLSDRVAVIYGGTIMKELVGDMIQRNTIGMLMAGIDS